MSKIFINGISAKAGGGKSILNNFVQILQKKNSTDVYYVLTPDKNSYTKFASATIHIIDVSPIYKTTLLQPITNHLLLPNLLKKLKIDIIFNLADIIIPTDIKQLFLFDWPYAVYPQSLIWQKLDAKSFFIRKVKLFFFNKYLHKANIILAQSSAMKKRLETIYGLNNVKIVPNAVSLDNLSGGTFFDFGLPHDKIKLLYLTHYYPHKNIEILLPLAQKIKKNNLPYRLIITIDAKQHKRAVLFLKKIKHLKLEDVIVNVHSVSMEHVPSLYQQCDALLMPTLLESFSGTYVEAMHHSIPIFTSDIDFATDVCGDAAFYFNPLSADLILETICYAFADNSKISEKVSKGKNQLKNQLNWEQVFEKYQYFLQELKQS